MSGPTLSYKVKNMLAIVILLMVLVLVGVILFHPYKTEKDVNTVRWIFKLGTALLLLALVSNLAYLKKATEAHRGSVNFIRE